MKKPQVIILVLLAVLGGLAYLLTQYEKSTDNTAEELTVHCAAGLQKPIREVAEAYEKEFGTKVRLNFAGSGVLESQLQIAGGDVFIPADDYYIESARSKGVVDEAIPLAELRACIVVQKGNPKNIQSISDLAQDGMRLSVAEPTAAVGKFVKKVLTASGDWEKIQPNILVVKPTVNNIVEDVSIKSVDAALAWDAVVLQSKHVEIVRVPVFEQKPRRANVGIIKGGKVTAALHFARYLSAVDKGRKAFAKYQFTLPAEADKWADVPELLLFSGSMLRPAIEERIRLFEKREGCRVSTVFEGCGTLISMMDKGGARPDSMFFCDSTFLTMVQKNFREGKVIADNHIVLLVPKGNPKNLRVLEDITKGEMKVGISDPNKSALGALTQKMLLSHQLWKPLKDSGNIITMVSKGDELVSQMQAGALDAALLYRSNARASKQIMDNCDIVAINDPKARATQPFAVSKETDYPLMMLRLRDFLTSDEARARYEELGFDWKKD